MSGAAEDEEVEVEEERERKACPCRANAMNLSAQAKAATGLSNILSVEIDAVQTDMSSLSYLI